MSLPLSEVISIRGKEDLHVKNLEISRYFRMGDKQATCHYYLSHVQNKFIRKSSRLTQGLEQSERPRVGKPSV